MSRKRTTNERRRDRLGLAAATIVLVSTSLTAVLSGGVGQAWDWINDVPRATVTSPPGPGVDHEEHLSGTYSSLPAGESIWAVTVDLTTNRLYPQDHPCLAEDGKFNCGTYYIGSDHGHGEYVAIWIVHANASASSAFGQYQIDKGGPTSSANPGISHLPAGAGRMGSVEVIRQ